VSRDNSPPDRVAIVFCITDLEMGGAERALVELVTRLPADRYLVRVVSLCPRPTGDNEAGEPRAVLAERLDAAGIETVYHHTRSRLRGSRLFPWFRRLLRRWRPKILQSFLFHANTLSAIVGSQEDVPHIVSGIRVAEQRWNLHRLMTRRTARPVKRHVCVSQSVADFARRRMRLPADRLVVIPNGIDPQLYPAAASASLSKFDVAAGRRAIVAVGRLDRQKRLDWLLDRMPELFTSLPDHDLLVVGEGKLRHRLQRQAERLDVARRVHFAGWRPDVAEILAAADLLVHTAAWEGMPNVVLEAMASGKPVVATCSEGVVELLGDGPTREGIPQVVAANDKAGFVAAVTAIAALARKLGEANRQRVEQSFTIDQAVAAYCRLYESLLAE